MSDTPKKVFDVARPGKTAPTASSKPIIITNRPVLKDPMMASGVDSGDTKPLSSRVLPSQGLKLKPLVHEEQPVPKEAAVESLPAPEETPESTNSDEAAASKTASEPEATQPDQKESSEDTKANSDTVSAEKKDVLEDEKAAREKAERAEELQKLAESRKYYLPINQVEKRRNKRYALLGIVLIIVLALAWADVALDAGIMSIPGVKAPTHFFGK